MCQPPLSFLRPSIRAISAAVPQTLLNHNRFGTCEGISEDGSGGSWLCHSGGRDEEAMTTLCKSGCPDETV
eukprot:15583522-Heterocapsa_arctica.AAC.1